MLKFLTKISFLLFPQVDDLDVLMSWFRVGDEELHWDLSRVFYGVTL